MPYLTGNWMNQAIPGYTDVYRGSTAPMAPAPVQAPAVPAPMASPMGGGGMDYWGQLASLLGVPGPSPAPQGMSMWDPSRMLNNPYSPVGAVNLSRQMFGANAYQPANRDIPMRGVGPASMQGIGSQGGNPFPGMPMFDSPSQQFRPGSNQGGRNSNPMLRSDGSMIDAQAYMRGDRPGMAPNPQGFGGGLGGGQRPQLAPPNRPAPTSSGNRRPSATFGSESQSAFPRQSPFEASGRNPAFRNFVY